MLRSMLVELDTPKITEKDSFQSLQMLYRSKDMVKVVQYTLSYRSLSMKNVPCVANNIDITTKPKSLYSTSSLPSHEPKSISLVALSL